MAALEAAGDPERFPDAGAPWQPLKLYYGHGFSQRADHRVPRGDPGHRRGVAVRGVAEELVATDPGPGRAGHHEGAVRRVLPDAGRRAARARHPGGPDQPLVPHPAGGPDAGVADRGLRAGPVPGRDDGAGERPVRRASRRRPSSAAPAEPGGGYADRPVSARHRSDGGDDDGAGGGRGPAGACLGDGLVPAQDPAPPPGKGPEFGNASPIGLVVVLLLLIATVVLIRSMSRRIRRLPASFDRRSRTAAEGGSGPSGSDGSDAPASTRPGSRARAEAERRARPGPVCEGGRMPNRLAGATSPYLLQHADNPVDWWEWSPEAFAEARRRDVPVLLSVGYAACHWCHVMAHESFEDPATAEQMNAEFVPVKVDREERPDVDAVYMAATQAMTGQGGWPMTCFLTPAGEPFYCGTYFPPQPRHGMPSFRQLLDAVTAGVDRRPRRVSARAPPRSPRRLGRAGGREPGAGRRRRRPPGRGRRRCSPEEFDPEHGGFGGAPKFPPSMVLEFLLRHHERTGSARALRDGRRSTCEAMARGGIYDQLAGGFARYGVDAGLGGPALREDALRQRAAAAGLRAPGATHRVAARAARRGGDGRVPAARPAHAGGRVRLGAGRGHRRRRGTDVRLDTGAAGRGARPGRRRAGRPSCCG